MSIGVFHPSDYELSPPDERHSHHGEGSSDGTHPTVEYQRRSQRVRILDHTEVRVQVVIFYGLIRRDGYTGWCSAHRFNRMSCDLPVILSEVNI